MPSHPGIVRIATIAVFTALATSTAVVADTSVRAWTGNWPVSNYIDDRRYRLVVRTFTVFEVSPPAPGGLVLRFEGEPSFSQWLAADVLTMTTAATQQRTHWNGQTAAALGGGAPPRGSAVQLTAATRATLITAAFHKPVVGGLDLFSRIGMLRTESRMLAIEATPAAASYDFRASRTAPWLGLGLRYRFGYGPALSAEYGAGDGLRDARITVGWRF